MTSSIKGLLLRSNGDLASPIKLSWETDGNIMPFLVLSFRICCKLPCFKFQINLRARRIFLSSATSLFKCQNHSRLTCVNRWSHGARTHLETEPANLRLRPHWVGLRRLRLDSPARNSTHSISHGSLSLWVQFWPENQVFQLKEAADNFFGSIGKWRKLSPRPPFSSVSA